MLKLRKLRKYTRNLLITCAQIEVYEVLRWGGQSAHIQILVNDNIGNRVCTDTGRDDLAFFGWIILQGRKQKMGSLPLFHPHTYKIILSIYSELLYLFKTLRSIVLLNAKEKVCLEKASFQYIGFGFVPRSTRTG